jgi:hypothetical protein
VKFKTAWEGTEMDIDFDGRVGLLTDFMPGTFFVTRDEQRTIFGISAMHSDDPIAILFNLAVNPTDPFPSLVPASFLGGMRLIGLMGAYLVPSLSQSAMEFSSTQQDGPGSLILTEDTIFMRVARIDGFFYFDVNTGLIVVSSPSGIEIPRWSVRLPERGGSALKLFEFDGPNPF